MSYKLSLSAFLTLVLSSTSALALTCANDYGGSDGCALNVTAAGDCETLGYATGDVEGCEHYLYCPFDSNYKRCVARSCEKMGFTTDDKSEWCGKIISCESDSNYTLCAQKPATCSVGELNPNCGAGYAKKQVGITPAWDACYECAPATCETASGGQYISGDLYFRASNLYLPKTQEFDIYSDDIQDNKSVTCYAKCSPELILKPITASDCSIGDWLVKFNEHYYCASTAQYQYAYSCASFDIVGVVAYFGSNNGVYVVYPLGQLPFTKDKWSGGSECPNYYNRSRNDGDFYYNYKILTGLESSQYSRNGCLLGMWGNQDLIERLYALNQYFYGGGLRYGIINPTAWNNITRNRTVVNLGLERAGLTQITTSDVWVDSSSYGLFTTKYGQFHGSTCNYSGTVSEKILSDAAQGIVVMLASEL